MNRAKNEPGVYLTISEVESKLKLQAYGISDLVDLGLFHSDHYARDAVNTGKLKAQKINKRAVIICRDDVLEYWRIYRNTPYEAANNAITVRFTISEIDYITALVSHGQKNVNKDFTKDDLFRNVLSHIRASGANSVNTPHIFKKHL